MTNVVKERLRRARRHLVQRLTPPSQVDERVASLGELVDAGASTESVVDRLRQLTEIASFSRSAAIVEETLSRVVGRGDLQQAIDISFELAKSVDGRYARLAHATALLCGDVAAAEAAASLADGQPWMTDRLRTRFAVQRSLATFDVPSALRLLAELPRPLDPLDSRLYLRALEAVGHFEDVLTFVRSGDHELDPTTSTLHEADALRWLGRADEAAELVTRLVERDVKDGRVLARMRDWSLTGVGEAGLAGRLRELEREASTAAARTEMLGLYFELDLITDAARVARDLEAGRTDANGAGLAPETRLLLARYHGAIGEFDRAVALLDSLMNSPQQTEAQKVRARIELEAGDIAGALATSSACQRPHGFMDEVSFSALMCLRRYHEAFSLAPNPKEWKPFVAVYGDRAEVDGTDLPSVGSRFVIAQGGPGDGIRFAATYPTLRRRSDELVVTCDPRLVTLLERSFPDVEFVPVERFNTRRPGGCGPGSPPRSGDVLYEWMTAPATARARRCDRVVLERSLHPLTLDPDGGAPYAAYLRPRADLVEACARRWPDERRRVGVVWRSELRGPRRGSEYLSAAEVASLLGPDDAVVCLQHDATTEEREQLIRLGAGRIEFVDDIDLRNDFETTAAFLACFDLVLGVGTTMIELSGSVGTRTVLLQPTQLGAWRAIDGGGQDFWHRSMRVMVAEPGQQREAFLERARDHLRREPIGPR